METHSTTSTFFLFTCFLDRILINSYYTLRSQFGKYPYKVNITTSRKWKLLRNRCELLCLFLSSFDAVAHSIIGRLIMYQSILRESENLNSVNGSLRKRFDLSSLFTLHSKGTFEYNIRYVIADTILRTVSHKY